MNKAEEEKVNQWLLSNVSQVCQSCHKETTFLVLDKIVSPLVFNEDRVLVVGGPSVPMVVLTCEHCFNMRFFSRPAILTG